MAAGATLREGASEAELEALPPALPERLDVVLLRPGRLRLRQPREPRLEPALGEDGPREFRRRRRRELGQSVVRLPLAEEAIVREQHLLEQQGVEPERRWADLAKRQQLGLIEALRRSRYAVAGRGPFGEEFVTAGGVPLGEVNLATMESRRVPGLHLVGELLDVDGITGGFNFQHCWSSGWLAGQAIAAAAALAAAPT